MNVRISDVDIDTQALINSNFGDYESARNILHTKIMYLWATDRKI